MKLVYGTNIWSHHQLPVATELARLLGPDQFRLAIFEAVHDERRRLGWGGQQEAFPWVIGPPRDADEIRSLLQACADADVMVVGDCPREVFRIRIATGKLTLVASERMLKKPFHRLRMVNPRYASGIRRYRALVDHPHVHALSIGHYAPDDLATIGVFNERIWKWGYFIEVPESLPEPAVDRPLKLLWCGRMLKWKRVDLLLKAVARLRDSGYVGECLIVGDGPERGNLLQLARRLRLPENFVRFHPPVAAADVRHLMRQSDVYVLASNRHEGWGAVAGEAMAEGCVLVANEQTGAARELVVDGETGLLFDDGDPDHLASRLELLSRNYAQRMAMRRLAFARMKEVWSPAVVAQRLLALVEGLFVNCPPDFAEGPCSCATTSRGAFDDNQKECRL